MNNSIRELKREEMEKIIGGLDQSGWTEQERYDYARVIKDYADAVKAKDQEWMDRAWNEMLIVIPPLREKYGF